jgi:excisionase family DNA binding protein
MSDATHIDELFRRLDRIEAAIGALLESHQAKEWYTTAEVAGILDRSDYTVREWCRKRQIQAEKAPNGRGWLISHAELMRIRNGERPFPENEAHPVIDRGR